MIFKTERASYSGISKWLWLDGIAKCESYGLMGRPSEVDVSHPEEPQQPNVFFEHAGQLEDAVSMMWGDREVRMSWMADEIDPLLDTSSVSARMVSCYRLERLDGSVVLALTDGPTYLMSDTGGTIERLNG